MEKEHISMIIHHLACSTVVLLMILLILPVPIHAQDTVDTAGILNRLKVDPVEWWANHYHIRPIPKEIPINIVQIMKENDLDPEAPKAEEWKRFFAAALKSEPGVRAQLKTQQNAFPAGHRETLKAILSQAEEYKPTEPASPRDFDLMWAEYQATGDPERVKRIIQVLELPETDENKGMILAAGKTLLDNCPKQHGSKKLVFEVLDKATGLLRERLKPVSDDLLYRASLTENLNRRALNLFEEGKLQEAIEGYCAALDVWQQFSHPYKNMAIIALENNDQPTAIALFERSLSISPDETYVLNKYARLMINSKRYNKAIELLARSAAVDKRDPYTQYLMGRAYRRKGDPKTALPYYQKYLALSPAGPSLTKAELKFLAERNLRPVVPKPDVCMENLKKKNFKALEELLTTLVTSKEKNSYGGSELALAMNKLSEDPEDDKSADRLELLEEWLKTYPSSHFANAIVGSFYRNYAWSARGGGWSVTITEDGRALFKERLMKARELLEKAWELDSKDPFPPEKLICVALEMGMGAEEVDKQFRRSVTADPAYYPAYESKLRALSPRWGGSKEALLAFARKSAAEAPPKSNVPWVIVNAHAYLASRRYHETRLNDYYKDPEVWSELKKVYQTLIKNFPDSYHDSFAKCAYDAGDFETARRELALVGDNWSKSRWGNAAAFEKIRKEIGAP